MENLNVKWDVNQLFKWNVKREYKTNMEYWMECKTEYKMGYETKMVSMLCAHWWVWSRMYGSQVKQWLWQNRQVWQAPSWLSCSSRAGEFSSSPSLSLVVCLSFYSCVVACWLQSFLGLASTPSSGYRNRGLSGRFCSSVLCFEKVKNIFIGQRLSISCARGLAKPLTWALHSSST